MDYDDISQIADAITDDIDTNSGLAKSISMSMSVFKPTRLKHTPDDYGDYDIPATSRSTRPLMSRSGTRAKSVTMLETKGFRTVPNKSTQKIAHQTKPKSTPKLGDRTLEL